MGITQGFSVGRDEEQGKRLARLERIIEEIGGLGSDELISRLEKVDLELDTVRKQCRKKWGYKFKIPKFLAGQVMRRFPLGIIFLLLFPTLAWAPPFGPGGIYGGGGATTLNALTDVTVSTVDGDSLVYSTGAGAWINSTVSGSGSSVWNDAGTYLLPLNAGDGIGSEIGRAHV